jgi:hypothetical protein
MAYTQHYDNNSCRFGTFTIQAIPVGGPPSIIAVYSSVKGQKPGAAKAALG